MKEPPADGKNPDILTTRNTLALADGKHHLQFIPQTFSLLGTLAHLQIDARHVGSHGQHWPEVGVHEEEDEPRGDGTPDGQVCDPSPCIRLQAGLEADSDHHVCVDHVARHQVASHPAMPPRHILSHAEVRQHKHQD